MTAAKIKPGDLPNWPRLLSREMAAAYVGVSPNAFDAFRIPALKIGTRRLYDRIALDQWVDDRIDAPQNDGSQSWMERVTQCGM